MMRLPRTPATITSAKPPEEPLALVLWTAERTRAAHTAARVGLEEDSAASMMPAGPAALVRAIRVQMKLVRGSMAATTRVTMNQTVCTSAQVERRSVAAAADNACIALALSASHSLATLHALTARLAADTGGHARRAEVVPLWCMLRHRLPQSSKPPCRHGHGAV